MDRRITADPAVCGKPVYERTTAQRCGPPRWAFHCRIGGQSPNLRAALAGNSGAFPFRVRRHLGNGT